MSTDAEQRRAALAVDRSCIVQAPAGSGKTGLLIQRMLALLAVVQRPDEILAITFTNKAAAEMRDRVLQALWRARDDVPPESEHERHTWWLAQRALQRHGTALLHNPAQLAIQTIDSLNAALVGRMPWISGFGGLPEISSEPDRLYRQAAERLFDRLDGTTSEAARLEVLLRHLDNQVTALQQLLCQMLARRDQWLRHLPLDLEGVRPVLEESLDALSRDHLQRLTGLFPGDLRETLRDCAHAAGEQLASAPDLIRLAAALDTSAALDREDWQSLAELLLTRNGDLRRTVNKRQGFPADQRHRQAREEMLEALEELGRCPEFVAALAQVRQLPEPAFSDQQWLVLEALVAVLPHLVAELWLVFKDSGQCDFAEIALQAQQALGSSDQPSDLLLKIDHRLQHILVDEFQDTSRLQFQLLELLTAGWQPDDGRTLFLVGDPMQSIYRFREAEVGLFLECFAGSFGSGKLPLETLRLRRNFRSQQGLVDWFNRMFVNLFPQIGDSTTGAVPYAPAESVQSLLNGDACRIHPFFGRDDAAEAERVCTLIEAARGENPTQSIAILVCSRSHLTAILPRLREAGIAYQAREIDPLAQRPAALDVVHLARALLHRADQLSWLAVLRAPWCGLTLDDLTVLAGERARRHLPEILGDAEYFEGLTSDGQQRIARVRPLLLRAHQRRGQLPLRDLIEGTWLALGGPSCYRPSEQQDALRVFDLLQELDRGGVLPSFEAFEARLQTLYAETESESDQRLQIMTMHKAKGLEFDTVLLPGLGKSAGQSDHPLLRWAEHPRYGLFMATFSARGASEPDPLYRFLARLERTQEDHESGRLLYVAATRARRRLHLLGHVEERSSGPSRPRAGSLLDKLWPQVSTFFESGHHSGVTMDRATDAHFAPDLTRLPAGWQPPRLVPVRLPVLSGATAASGAARGADPAAEDTFSGWESHRQRHIGTLVHAQLERLTRSAGRREQVGDASQQAYFRNWLQARGVIGEALDTAVTEVIGILLKTLASSRGRWILTEHPQADCELPLCGVIDGQVHHAVIDRTFVDQGQRWVIDYKTSSPADGETLDTFVAREARRYQSQMAVYGRLLKIEDDRLPVRKALYFPVCDGWYVYVDEPSRVN